ncbi:hypothetical protein AAF712_014369 [Marasmius tenuissimus]|uniref:Uncharacterized protein n=1 Tax=Marasmius tenuissimus TaxID=585030 RepID=A0ABR2ZBA1_9AGAR
MSAPVTKKKKPAISKTLTQKYNTAVPSYTEIKKTTKATKSRYVPMSTAERLRRRRERRETAQKIQNAVVGIRNYVRDECLKLGKTYKRKQRYFLDMVYQGGVRLTKPANNPNDFNMFKSVIAHERREAGEPPMSLLKIQEVYRPQYDALDDDGMKEIVEKYQAIQEEAQAKGIKRPSLKEKGADVAGSLSNVQGILQGLKTRVGIEAFLLVVRNRPEDYMGPTWIVTDERLMEYMRILLRHWNPVYIGQKMEAFAVTGCNMASVCKNPKEHADLLKKEIGCMVQDALDEACITTNLSMQYERFDTIITAKYGVVVEGWPKGLPFQKPGSMGDLDSLLQVHEAWKSGTARFRKLSPEEFSEWKTARVQGLTDGTIIPKTRKKRRDAGVPRKKKTADKTKDLEEDEDESDESDESGDEQGNVERETTPSNNRKASRPSLTAKGNRSDHGGRDVHVGKTKKTAKSGGPAKTKTISSKRKPRATSTSSRSKKSATDKRTESEPMDDDNIPPLSLLQDNVGPADPSPPAPPRPKPRQKTPSRTVDGAALEEQGINGDHRVANDDPATPVPGDGNVVDNRIVSTRVSSSDTSADNHCPASPPVPDSVIDPSLLSNDSPGDQQSSPTATPLPPPNNDPPCTSETIVPEASSGSGKRKRELTTSTEADNGVEGRGKRKRVPRKITHLGASTHPRSKDDGSGAEDGMAAGNNL